ncbi:hypothetical protein CH333_07650, partial [candidate division WOR-3 bacterium JGI_Cruoil_03_44_89]
LSQTFENLELVLEIPDPDTASGGFGISLNCGDVNGDEHSDIVVGRVSGSIEGKIYIYLGGPGFDNSPDVTLIGESYSGYGHPVAVGDINGDGYDDVIAGRPLTVKIYLGGDPMDSISDVELFEPSEDDVGFSGSVACGDLNNDGYDDYIVGAYGTNNYVGRVYIYFGGSEPDTIPDVILNGEEVSNFGTRLASGQDVNGDGYEDLFVTAIIYGPYQGKTYIYYGGDPMDTIPDVEMYGTRPFDFFGETISLIPDLENDGYDEAAVGEPLDATHDTVFTYFGGDPMDENIDAIFLGEEQSYYGYTFCGAKISSISQFQDFVVGAPRYGSPEDPNTPEGEVYLYIGGDPVDIEYDAKVAGADAQKIGGTVASGDIDGDRIDKIIFSNYFTDYTLKKVWVCKYTGTGIEEESEPDSTVVRLIKTYPNPFNDYTKIEYQLGGYVSVSLKVYDVSGRLVKTLVNCRQTPGLYSVRWDGKDERNNMVSVGVYFCELKVERSKGQKVKRTRKLVCLGH